MTYGDKLKDPRWQKKRLEILSRDEWTCQFCLDTTKMLVVHHLFYDGREPWEYKNQELLTLCQSCHDAEHEHSKDASMIVNALKMKGVPSPVIHDIACSIHALDVPFPGEVIGAVLSWMFSSGRFQGVIQDYFKYLHQKNESRSDQCPIGSK